MKYEEDFDGLLNDALSEVREAEPRMGLEGRVLAGVSAGAEERRIPWWKWSAVAAALVVILLAATVRRPTKVDVVRKELPKQVVVPEKRVEEAKSTAAPKRSSERRQAMVTVARREVVSRARATETATAKATLLGPRPMNDQEKALMLLARSNPGVLESVRRDQQGANREVAPIRIEDIEISGIGEKEQ